MKKPMPVKEFRSGLLSLADDRFEKYQARLLALKYRTADEDARMDCSRMLREDLASRAENETP